MPWERVLTDWLPDTHARLIRDKEEERFSTLVRAVSELAAAIPDKSFVFDNAEIIQQSVKWIPHIDVFVKVKVKYDVQLAAELYKAMMHIVIMCQHDSLTQARWLNSAHSLLRAYRKDFATAGVVVDWKLYWDEFVRQTDALKEYRFDGHIKITAYMYLHSHCKVARRLFGSAAAAEIWARITPAMDYPLSPECLEAAVYMLTFFPHHAIATATDLPWQAWAEKCLAYWDQFHHNLFWDAAWMCLLSRLAKHDLHGVINWEVVVKAISSRVTWLFSVPVGSVKGSTSHYLAPRAPLGTVIHQASNRSSSVQSHLAKILVYTLRTPLGGAAAAPDGLTSFAALQGLSRLLVHYFHASNAGSWSKELAGFLDSLSWHLIRRRLPAEAPRGWRHRSTVKLDPHQLGPMADLMTELALPCMYHKNSSLQFASVEVITNVVYLQPAKLLPVVWRRFIESLEASDSVHQLQIAFRVLAGCVRPMLLFGLEATPEEKELMDAEELEAFEPRRWACKELGRAMMLLLPGLDANDRNKTLAAIGFYLSVLSNCVAIRGADCPREEGECAIELGLYLEDFIVEFLDRVFGVMEALDTAGQGMDLAAVNEKGRHLIDPSWLGDYYKFTALVQQLFAKVPRSVLHVAVRKVAQFAYGLVIPQQAADMYQIVAACAAEAPDLTCELLLKPLMARVIEDANAMDGKNPSPAAVSSMLTRINVIHGIVPGLCHGEMTLHAEGLLEMVEAAAKVTAPGVAEMASLIIERLLMNLGCPYVMAGDYAKAGAGAEALGIPDSINGAVAAWCPKDGAGVRRVVWHVPSEEEVQLARRLAENIVAQVARDVDALIADGSIADSNRGPRLRLRWLQCKLGAVVMGLEDVLPPLDVHPEVLPQSARTSPAADSIAVCDVPLPGWQGCQLIAGVVRVALSIAEHADASNAWSLKAVVHDLTRMNGIARASASSQHLATSIRSRDRSYNEPQISGLMLGKGVSEFSKQPHWAIELRVEQHFILRLSLLPYSWWATAAQPALPLASMDPLLLKGVAALQQLSLHRYRTVALCAGHALCENYLVWSPELVSATFPGFIAALALLQDDPACGLPPEKVALEGGYELPKTAAEIDAVLAAQHAALSTMLDSATMPDGSVAVAVDGADAAPMDVDPPANGGAAPLDGGSARAPGGGASAAASAAGARNGVCRDENKHILVGVYNVLDITPHLQTRLTTGDPRCLATMFMALLVMQRYTLQEVKGATNKTIATVGVRLHRSVAVIAQREVPPLHNLARLLIAKIRARSLHWRAVGMAHVLFMLLAPVAHDTELLAAITTLQLQHFAMEDIPLIKDTACVGILQTMKAAFEPGIAPAFRDEVCRCVRDALGSSPWAAKLLASLTAMHSMSNRDRLRATLATNVTPEQGVVTFMRSAVTLNSTQEGRLHLNPTPAPPADDGQSAAADIGPQVYLIQLAEAFGRIAPRALLDAAREQLTAWNQLPPEKEAEEPNMEYAAMELCAGLACSGAAFEAADGGATAWTSWLRDIVEHRHTTATLQKSPLWASTVAQMIRMLANAQTSAIPEIAAQFDTRDSCERCLDVVDFVCAQVASKVTGSSTGDVKYASLLSYSIDMLAQVQSRAPRRVISTALERLLVAGELLVRQFSSHPLHSVRMGAAALTPVILGTLRSPAPLVDARHCDEADAESVAARVVAGVRASVAAAAAALADSNAACERSADGAGASGALEAGTPNGGLVDAWEASIGFAVALNTCLAGNTILSPLMQDLLQDSLPWVIDVQALQHPKLQTLALRVRGVLVVFKYVMVRAADVPAVLRTLWHKCSAPAWQARAAALSALQSFWFRNYFLMSDVERMDTSALLLQLLSDEKLEIRQLASTTLSGLLQCLQAPYAGSVRARIMDSAAGLFPAGRRKSAASRPDKDAVTQSHACVLGLRAVLLSSPYEIAPWMSDVLMAIVRASRLPAPVKTTCTSSLGEFRKTHETSESRPLKERLDPDVWTSICDVAMQSSYFV